MNAIAKPLVPAVKEDSAREVRYAKSQDTQKAGKWTLEKYRRVFAKLAR